MNGSLFQVDSNGNNVLHLLVIHNLPKIYTKFKQRWIETHQQDKLPWEEQEEDENENQNLEKTQNIPLWKRLNKEGYTPLTLAAKLNQYEMFSFLLEERKITQWSYGPVSCVLYPLDQVDLDFQHDVHIFIAWRLNKHQFILIYFVLGNYFISWY